MSDWIANTPYLPNFKKKLHGFWSWKIAKDKLCSIELKGWLLCAQSWNNAKREVRVSTAWHSETRYGSANIFRVATRHLCNQVDVAWTTIAMQLSLLLLLCWAVEALSVPTNETLWGAYRPNLYFGLRPTLPKSLMAGLVWFGTQDYQAAASKSTFFCAEFKAQKCTRTSPLVWPRG